MNKLGLLLTGFALAATATATATAAAKWRRLHVSTCHWSDKDLYLQGGSWLVNSGDHPAQVTCPLPEDHNFTRAETDALNVHVLALGQQELNRAQTCVYSIQTGTLVSCGAWAQTTGTAPFNQALRPDLTPWKNHPAGMAIVAIELAADDVLFGWFTSD
jgi:hypothetical protein